jgi:hypothetical protein
VVRSYQRATPPSMPIPLYALMVVLMFFILQVSYKIRYF